MVVPFAARLLDEADSSRGSAEALEFRAHLKKQRGPAARSVGSWLASGPRGLAQRLNPPAPVDLIAMPEDTFGGGWTPDADIDEED